MLYGHIEQPRHRIDHLVRLRELQDETGGFQTFIPLAFHPENNKLGIEKNIKKPSSLMDLRQMAIGAADARQHRPREGVLDHARRTAPRSSRSPTAPTTSTAPCATS